LDGDRKETARNEGVLAHSALDGFTHGIGDYKCDAGQARIATEKVRDRHDIVIVQEKLDGSCETGSSVALVPARLENRTNGDVNRLSSRTFFGAVAAGPEFS
jgi:hypothetical protein